MIGVLAHALHAIVCICYFYFIFLFLLFNRPGRLFSTLLMQPRHFVQHIVVAALDGPSLPTTPYFRESGAPFVSDKDYHDLLKRQVVALPYPTPFIQYNARHSERDTDNYGDTSAESISTTSAKRRGDKTGHKYSRKIAIWFDGAIKSAHGQRPTRAALLKQCGWSADDKYKAVCADGTLPQPPPGSTTKGFKTADPRPPLEDTDSNRTKVTRMMTQVCGVEPSPAKTPLVWRQEERMASKRRGTPTTRSDANDAHDGFRSINASISTIALNLTAAAGGQKDPLNHWRAMLNSNFCLEPGGDTPTRSHLYTAALCGCIPVIFDFEPDTPEHREQFYRGPDATSGWAFRHTPLPYRLDYETFAVVYNASDVITGKINITKELLLMPRRQPARFRMLKDNLAHAARWFYYSPYDCGTPLCDAFSAFQHVVSALATGLDKDADGGGSAPLQKAGKERWQPAANANANPTHEMEHANANANAEGNTENWGAAQIAAAAEAFFDEHGPDVCNDGESG